MAESPIDKTTRKVVSALETHEFSFYASVYLNAEDIEINKRTIERAKRLIKLDNPDQLIFYFISRNANPVTGVVMPYMSFYSHEQLVGTRLMAEQTKFPEAFNISNGGVRKQLISTKIEHRYQGIIDKIRDGKVFDLTRLNLPEKFKRFGFLNDKNNK